MFIIDFGGAKISFYIFEQKLQTLEIKTFPSLVVGAFFQCHDSISFFYTKSFIRKILFFSQTHKILPPPIIALTRQRTANNV